MHELCLLKNDAFNLDELKNLRAVRSIPFALEEKKTWKAERVADSTSGNSSRCNTARRASRPDIRSTLVTPISKKYSFIESIDASRNDMTINVEALI